MISLVDVSEILGENKLYVPLSFEVLEVGNAMTTFRGCYGMVVSKVMALYMPLW